MGKKVLVYLSHPFGDKCPLWPYFEDVKIERMHYMAKSGVLSQKVTTVMHCTTHADSPAHVVEGTEYTHEIPLDKYYGTGVVVDIPKKKWQLITADDLEKATPRIEKGDIVIVHTGWNKYWGDSQKYFLESPGLGREAGEWFEEKGVKCVGVDQQALDHPLLTTIGPHGPGPLRPDIFDEYKNLFGKAILFPSDVEALGGNLPQVLLAENWWSPHHPFQSSLDGTSAKALCDAWTRETNKSWTAPLGFKYAGYEIAADAVRRAGTLDKKALLKAIAETNLNTIVGPIHYNAEHFSETPLVGGQWVKGKKFKWEMEIVYDQHHPEIPSTAELKYPLPR